MFGYLTTGIVLGLSAGLAPGPLLALVVAETLRHGVRAGIKVALAPVLTDLPIILVTVLVLERLSKVHLLLGVVSLGGALLIAYFGYESLRYAGGPVDPLETPSASLRKGVLVNFLNPNPYLFWISVGAPLIVRALQTGPGAAAAFVASFYLLLVGSKVVLAVLAGRSRAFLAGRAYVVIQRALGLVLWVFAAFLVRDGLRLVGLLPSGVSGL